MSMEKWFKDKLKTFEKDLDYRLETLILDIIEQISKRMKEMGINRTNLSKKLNISPPAVTKILNGNSNFTIKTLLSLADALEQDLKIEFTDKKIVTHETVIESYLYETAGESYAYEFYPACCTSVDNISIDKAAEESQDWQNNTIQKQRR